MARTGACEAQRMLHYADGDYHAPLLEAGHIAKQRQAVRGRRHDARRRPARRTLAKRGDEPRSRSRHGSIFSCNSGRGLAEAYCASADAELQLRMCAGSVAPTTASIRTGVAGAGLHAAVLGAEREAVDGGQLRRS